MQEVWGSNPHSSTNQVGGYLDLQEDQLWGQSGPTGAGRRCRFRIVASTRGVSFEHKKGTACTDSKFHRHCQGRWRGSVSLGFDA
jgi:hypothetical protein